MSDELLVVDTSSLAQVRQIEWIGIVKEKVVFARLTKLVEADRLVYPPQVVDELAQYKSRDKPYLPLEWAKKHKRHATRYGPVLDVVAKLMAHPQLCKVMDPDKDGADEADPHVLALALHLKEDGNQDVVLNEERRDRPTKLSINTACGLLRVYSLSVEAFIVQNGILTSS